MLIKQLNSPYPMRLWRTGAFDLLCNSEEHDVGALLLLSLSSYQPELLNLQNDDFKIALCLCGYNVVHS